jgi:hypothetical protein
MTRASRAAASAGKKAAAAAALAAYEDNLDLALQLGWAHVDRITFEARMPPTPLSPTPCDLAACAPVTGCAEHSCELRFLWRQEQTGRCLYRHSPLAG